MFPHYFLHLLLLQLLTIYPQSSTANPLLGEKVKPARTHEFPFVVSLSRRRSVQKKENHRYGGALISKKHILTSAHCVTYEHPDDVVAIVGNAKIESGQVRESESWITYDEWAKARNVAARYDDNDIAIVTLKKSVKDVKPGIISRLRHDEVIKKNVVTVGWGHINETAEVWPETLQKVNLKVLSLEDYKEVMKSQSVPVEPALNNYYTVAYPTAMLGCGDSGGPLLLSRNYEIVGVNDSSCDVDEPEEEDNVASFHIVVDYYRDFIADITKK